MVDRTTEGSVSNQKFPGLVIGKPLTFMIQSFLILSSRNFLITELLRG